MPDVTGIGYAKGRAELRELGLDVRRYSVAGAEPVNIIVRQSIDPGQSVVEGQVIRLGVSDGTLSDDPGTFADVYETTSDGVMRIETTACDGGGHGSGFLIAPDLVMTVAHVVDGAVSVAVSGAKEVSAGEVIGIDPENELALVKTETMFGGHVFEFVDDSPPVGANVAVLGYPLYEPLSLTEGNISGLDRVINVDEVGRLEGVLQTDAAINPGNSGGPLVDTEGRVVGLAEAERVDAEGIAYAVAAGLAKQGADEWATSPQPPIPPSCEVPVGPGSTTVASDIAHADLAGVTDTLQSYFDGINFAEYAQAYDQFSPDKQAATSFPDFRAGLLTSLDSDVRIRSIDEVDSEHDRVLVTFWSVQEPEHGPDGQGCTKWTLDYSMSYLEGRWFIEGAQEHGSDGSAAC